MLGHFRIWSLTSLDVSRQPGKQASAYADEDILNPFSMSYASMQASIFGFHLQSDSHLQVRTLSIRVDLALVPIFLSLCGPCG